MDPVRLPASDATWVPGAEGSGFGRANLPYGAVARPGQPAEPAVRVGTHALRLQALEDAGVLSRAELPAGALAGPVLNPLLALGPDAWARLRGVLQDLLAPGAHGRAAVQTALVPLAEVELRLPVAVGDFVDFYASLEHATALGRRFRPEGDPLLPNWRHLPVGYHGRAGSVAVSGTPVRRPHGQLGLGRFGPTEELDLELELGAVTGGGGEIFGFVVVNDWSARDIQRWEYQPLGPFLGKSFATSISGWVVPLDALAGARVPPREQDPEPLPYLRDADPWALDAELEVEVNGTVRSRANARTLYWTFPQMLAHATVNGAHARPGDLFASGTISAPGPGSLVELGDGFLRDGDAVVLRGACGAVSLGEVAGTVTA